VDSNFTQVWTTIRCSQNVADINGHFLRAFCSASRASSAAFKAAAASARPPVDTTDLMSFQANVSGKARAHALAWYLRKGLPSGTDLSVQKLKVVGRKLESVQIRTVFFL